MVFGSGLAFMSLGGAAHAQCPDPVDEILLFPQLQTSGVPVNVELRAEFPSTRDPHGVPRWRVLDDRGNEVDGEATWDGSTSTFVPADELGHRRTYTARVTVQSTGEFWQASFATSSETDGRAPRFDGASSVSWSQRSESWLLENCRLARGDGFLFTIDVPTATDDSTDQDDQCLYIYQTAGPGADDDTPIARVRANDSGQVTLLRAVEEGEGEFCFRVEARDLAGRFDGNRREVCVDAIAGAIYGDICSTAGLRPRVGRLELLFAVFSVVAWLVIRRRSL